METVLIVVHLMIVVAMIGVILLQKSEGGALGIGGGGGGFMTGRGAANALTRTTMYLAAGFFVTSIALTVLHRGGGTAPSVLDSGASQTQSGAPAANDGSSVLDQLGGAPNPDGPQVPQSQ